MAQDADCDAAYAYAIKTGCIIRYERSFTRPVLDGATLAELGLLP